MTDTDTKIADYLLEGLPNREIAARLGMPTRRVKDHLARLYELYEVPKDRIKKIYLAMEIYRERNPS
jgi:DNA-binding CsgD family transcriptional regulator